MSSFSFFDTTHWNKVRAERRRLGLTPVDSPAHSLVKHALLNQDVLDVSTGVSYIVESVRKDWRQGYFLSAILRVKGTKSHRLCFIENKSCVDEAILSQIDLFRTNFKLA